MEKIRVHFDNIKKEQNFRIALFAPESIEFSNLFKRDLERLYNLGEFNNLMQQMINFIFVELWKNYAGD